MPLEPCKVINQRTGRVIAEQGRIARDYSSRSVGLLNRSSLGDDEALLIYPCNSIHTFFMKFPIDVAFLDKKHKVVKISENILPWRLESCHFIAKSTLEMNVGSISRKDIKVGDIIIFE
jgi:uncharacterized membrane protein (UPF0127 family)